ncbi:MAG: tetraacyldisaccharide 4'-kinase [Gammaproteobacteria bacterium]|nr:tetraacyldisaccharide 4'-kinase [Gammaproteobacteria bacterium]HBW83860.1 tetraacyldisaccharide 4'-kinase [Gammaproteobacteria bacterium]|tara:strand:+ start:7442 stop:8464 length:1023 start_codon:yes stop_codon:yes gene_type:complete
MNFMSKAWHRKSFWLWLLLPFSLLVRFIALRRLRALRKYPKLGQHKDLACPVIVVGNITTGGTGKTPLVIALARHLNNEGFVPAIISRGYKSKAPHYPLLIDESVPVIEAGDEPSLIYRHTECPVVIDPDRAAALRYVRRHTDADVVLSDDGLQHYGLPRSYEICVVDPLRLFGNELCLPAGPLREPISRLQQVDAVVLNGDADKDHPLFSQSYNLRIDPVALVNISTGERRPLSGAPFKIGTTIDAVAALGNPNRFFKLFNELPYQIKAHSYPDHYRYKMEDFQGAAFADGNPIVMTKKDGIKCEAFADSRFWCLDVKVEVDPKLLCHVSKHVLQFVDP